MRVLVGVRKYSINSSYFYIRLGLVAENKQAYT